ncbi:hypothetical protein [Blastomonas sp. AAP25]|uniref:hypothetical protein n=1 Tax=Blastomonas sp. AAP25 TaxID=1523416 RepID=UPI0012E133DB|nr:hypothetical protein [Blastomonas sp. AAP25]
MQFAAKGYLQIAITRKHLPNIDLHRIELGYAEQLLDAGCSAEQAFSTRWGGVRAIQDEPESFEDAIEAMRQARRECGMPAEFEDKAEAEIMYLAAALSIVTLANFIDPKDYETFCNYVGV